MMTDLSCPPPQPPADVPAEPGSTPFVKSALDRSVAALLLILTSLWLALIALAVWLEDDGPLLVREERVGRQGRPFRLLRFRTSPWRGAAGRRPGAAGDTTSTVGRLLRRYHLDDLPQLVNVVRGDLSLVGPRARPTTEGRAALHPAVRPGLIDPWDPRTPPRSEAEELRAVRVYLQEWSPWRDLSLAWRAVRNAVPSRRPGLQSG